MFNLLRMDLYRMKRSRSVYVCLGILLGLAVMAGCLVWLMGTPEGNRAALKLGLFTSEETAQMMENENILEDVDMVEMFRDIGMNGGAYCTILGIVVALFVCMDFQSGFMKNIMALHRERWKYIVSKLMAAGILNFCYMVLFFGMCLVVNMVFHLASHSGWSQVIFYMAWAWLVSTAFLALVIMICVLTRSTAMGVLGAVLFGSGAVVVPVASVMNLFHMGGWANYTIYFSMTYGPSAYSGAGDLKVFAVGAVFLLLYAAAATVVTAKRDVA